MKKLSFRKKLLKLSLPLVMAFSVSAVGVSFTSSDASMALADSSSSSLPSVFNAYISDLEGVNEGDYALHLNGGTSFDLRDESFVITSPMVGFLGNNNIRFAMSGTVYDYGNLYFDVRGGTQYLMYKNASLGASIPLADAPLTATADAYRGAWQHVRAGWDGVLYIQSDSIQAPISSSFVYNVVACTYFALGYDTDVPYEDEEVVLECSPSFWDGINYLNANNAFSVEYGSWYMVPSSDVYDGSYFVDLNPYSWVVPFQLTFRRGNDGVFVLEDYWLAVLIVPSDSHMFSSGIISYTLPFWFRFGYNYVSCHGDGSAIFGVNDADLIAETGQSYNRASLSSEWKSVYLGGAYYPYVQYSIAPTTTPYDNSVFYHFTDVLSGYYSELVNDYWYGQYDKGFKAGRLTAINSDVFQAGYDAGYDVGFSAGARSGGPGATLLALFGSVVSVPINVLNGLSPLVIWDTPIISIVLSFMMIGVLLFIVKRFI